ncbi:isopenicillin N synthase family oxygenase [Tenacibaculum dicentrarchi]|uniref:isopenicillin N synthase family dioxygenase n=1 Tax=Tenacibaculum finnmarkense TaxID=2781243 RepID=UPI00187B9A26|nr:isopenicillin N synthase family oxygenase [Tenacibaculum finnmarkense]MCD8414518.1 isopenicillin N synthase family oxygenase [Tenacibaculum dicentrarchi]MBE7648722.1 isopenicillin N synthase family oxygenase [Tenacibaculum finnmarkense genomovar ulcerans]MCD8419963.1 isopenicillin N synthase family oxygenase [Tenacibaculum dicentrarchi]MCD8437025.1 isopenicillin N synthase family oxygenase [Tenacibaculum dicentrarchi]MCD8452086.1 isopenicillin N synthase family oxygenase [Tenacibaculum dice
MNKIPSVNLADFLSEDKNRKQKFINEIGDAYQNIGFVALKGHFLDDELVDNLYTEIKNFFDLPTHIKEKYEIPGIGGQRGYISFGKESAKGKKEGDLKEFWHFGQYVDAASKYAKEYPENVNVEELAKFNEIGKKTYQMLEKTAKYVLRSLALHLDLEETYFDNFIKDGNSILRPIHYPPIQSEPKGAERAAAHGDINLITLLMGAQGKGLQVQNNNGDWLDAVAQPDELMINVGDMLSRHSNNKLKSTIHRVTNPPKELWGTSRYSIPFFMHPVSDMKLDVLENCIDEQNPKQFEDITAGEFLDERLRELGLKK